MKGITIRDKKNGALAFDLIDILNVVGEKAATSLWTAYETEAVGETAERLHELSDNRTSFTGSELLAISSGLVQVIEGTFEAYLEEAAPWLVIRAVDSSEFDVETCDQSVLIMLRTSFKEVENLPN